MSSRIIYVLSCYGCFGFRGESNIYFAEDTYMLRYPDTQYTPFWGTPTATIDWCEENYLFTPYIAELVNALTNIAFIFLACQHIYSTIKYGHGRLYLFISLGFASVGFGSFLFHSTLLYEHQMMDELPMVWTTAIPFGYIFGWQKSQPYRAFWNVGTFFATVFFTYTYIKVWRNPVYHQIYYAALNFGVIYKSLKTIKQHVESKQMRHELYKLLAKALALFATGFVFWNLDNIYCTDLIRMRRYIGWPAGFILEGHGWWHLFTGLGIYHFIAYNMLMSACLEGEGRIRKRWGLVVIERATKQD